MSKISFNERFVRAADWVSFAIGTPANIGFWIFAVALWIAMGPWIATHNFMPDWFTSNAFNFPLNTVTTLAELYIGFLVAAATNRSERALRAILDHLGASIDQDIVGEDNLAKLLEQNTALTQQVHDLTVQVHTLLTQAQADRKEPAEVIQLPIEVAQPKVDK